MNCFAHNASAIAVGICKHCQKGVCIDCVEFVNASISCKDPYCKVNIQEEDQCIEKTKKAYKIGKYTADLWSGLYSMVVNIAFISYCIYHFKNTAYSGFELFMVLGSILILTGTLFIVLENFYRNIKAKRNVRKHDLP